MQLWESRPHLLDTTNSSVERARDMEAQESTQESTMQLRQIQRWLDESTMEKIQELHQAQRWTGSTLLRTLNTSKLRHRQQQRSDRHHRSQEQSRAAATVTTVKAVTQWLTWITEMEMHQTLRQQLDHPNEQYRLHLEATYTEQLKHHQDEESAADGGIIPGNDTRTTAAGPNLADPGIDILDRAEPIIADQQDHHANTPAEAAL